MDTDREATTKHTKGTKGSRCRGSISCSRGPATPDYAGDHTADLSSVSSSVGPAKEERPQEEEGPAEEEGCSDGSDFEPRTSPVAQINRTLV